MTSKIADVILKVAKEHNPSLSNPIDISKGEMADLYGRKGSLDSLALVRFIVDVEAALEDELGVSVALANEKAMSQARSPFLTVGSMAAYVSQLLNETERP